MEVSDDTIEKSRSSGTAEFRPIYLSLSPPAGRHERADVARKQGFHGWTLMMISAGIGLLACCILIPQTDENRRLAYNCLRLKADLEHLEKQAVANDEFIRRIVSDPTLSERLAQRQMQFVRKGSGVLDLNEPDNSLSKSPFSLLAIDAPAEVPKFRTPDSRLADLCRNPKSRLYLVGAGLMLLALGLVLGSHQNDVI
jgi:hypothetical protein